METTNEEWETAEKAGRSFPRAGGSGCQAERKEAAARLSFFSAPGRRSGQPVDFRGYDARMIFNRSRISSLAAGLVLVAGGVLAAGEAWAEDASLSAPYSLSSAQIVEQMQRHNQARTDDLKHYQSVRHYQVVYQGFPHKIVAGMDVEVNYDARSGKSFHFLSQSGSKGLCEKVLKRAVESEREAQQDKGATALTPENYRFQLAGSENLQGRPAYILAVEPRVKSKFLYRGKIWVDATDFAVAKIQAHPALNPSFWTKQTDIDHTYAKVGEFWLPARNKTVSRILFGGTATLIIDYTAYDVAIGDSPTQASRPVPIGTSP